MLDSSPVALPPIPRPMKRSSSTASLPTPPRTQRKRRVRGSARSQRVDSEDVGESSDELIPNKRRRMSHVKESHDDFDDEDTFWTGTKSTKKPEDSNIGALLDRQSLSPQASPVPLLQRRRQRAQSTTSSLASPPPSFRKPKAVAAPKPAAFRFTSPTPSELPSTPKAKYFPPPIRDSPNNPFLDDDSDADAEAKAVVSVSAANTEKPTVTFVFRGVRKSFPNPYYDPVKQGPVSPSANSLLPLEHPDFSPDTRCPPKVLFPKTKKPQAEVEKPASRLVGDITDAESDEDDDEFKPIKLFT